MTLFSEGVRLNILGRQINISQQQILLLIILLVALLLRLANLGGRSLWLDEAFSIVESRREELAGLAEVDTGNPPGYFMLLHAWTNWFGDSEAISRLPSALISTLNVFLLYLLGRRLFGVEVGLLAATLLALSPLDIWYAQETRAYAFLVFVGLLMAVGLAWENSVGGILYFIGLGVGLYFGYLVVPLWMGICVMWLIFWWRRGHRLAPFLIWLLASIAGWLAYEPWWWGFRNFVTKNLAQPFLLMRLRDALGLTALTPLHFFLALVGSGLLLLAGCLILLWLLRQPRLRKLVTLLAVIAFAAVTLSMMLPRLYLVKRVLVTGWPFIILLVAWLVMQLDDRRRSVTRALLGLSLLVSIFTLFFLPKPDWRAAAAHLAENVNDGETILLDPGFYVLPVEYYQPRLVTKIRDSPRLPRLAEDAERIWMVTTRYPGQSIPSSFSEDWLDENWDLLISVPYYQLEVRYYGRR